jgi:AcrR family transcriptional regulator
MRFQMKVRGIEIQKMPFFASNKNNLLVIQLSRIVAVFLVAMLFYTGNQNPSEADIQHLLDRTEHQISYGLGFSEKDLDAINYDELDEIISCSLPSEKTETDSLLKAVANAIAQAGAKDASMEMVAKHAGLSKSGLYSHFKNKEDMLRKFFTIEFEKTYGDLAAFPKTEKPEEQLYLLGASTIRYLQARPEIMIALDWIRTQRIDLGLSMPQTVIDRFSDTRFIKQVHEKNDLQMELSELPHFIIFCIMGFLKSHYCMGKEIQLSNENIRFFYKFIISGIKR